MANRANMADTGWALEEKLERGEIVSFPVCPFPLPEADDRDFLFRQRQSRWHKNITLNPENGKLSGHCRLLGPEMERLRCLLAAFADEATAWLARLLPRYARGWRRDRVTLRPEEEATRLLRPTARNDLFHIDAFPSRPTGGARILRLYANINRDEPRVWATTDSFPQIYSRFGPALRQPGKSTWLGRLRHWLGGPPAARDDYDAFMLRLHNFLKINDVFQERCPKRFWKFPPNSCWLAFTDGVCHAELRGCFALEHSYLVPTESLSLPGEAPAAIFKYGVPSPQLAKAA